MSCKYDTGFSVVSLLSIALFSLVFSLDKAACCALLSASSGVSSPGSLSTGGSGPEIPWGFGEGIGEGSLLVGSVLEGKSGSGCFSGSGERSRTVGV